MLKIAHVGQLNEF